MNPEVITDYQPADGKHPVVVEFHAVTVGLDEPVANEIVTLRFYTKDDQNLTKNWWHNPLPLQVYSDPGCTKVADLVTDGQGSVRAYIVCTTGGEEAYYVQGVPGGQRGDPQEVTNLQDDPKAPIHFTKPR
ncbi:hypothetical protein BAU08_15110 [Bordetella bronchialis]|uniref:Uncharacterized protein n=1 Tax=Bordetella bronchialis TaxID=463025 RepID=A0A193FYN8_9BORD|nr:hypothetical protein BAU06_14865 [Bordetella bronchialis]ANN72498.1 hypothetical protein BAU08_15110 [Bordetella bronchialis]